MLEKIVSGGQTGVDRAALDVALGMGFPCGGRCPAGRLAEDGSIPDAYPLTEMDTPSYLARTRANVLESDATLAIHFGPLTGGTARTVDLCHAEQKPCLTIDGTRHTPAAAARVAERFVADNRVAVLNVAGPRASGEAKAYDYAYRTIEALLSSRLED